MPPYKPRPYAGNASAVKRTQDVDSPSLRILAGVSAAGTVKLWRVAAQLTARNITIVLVNRSPYMTAQNMRSFIECQPVEFRTIQANQSNPATNKIGGGGESVAVAL